MLLGVLLACGSSVADQEEDLIRVQVALDALSMVGPPPPQTKLVIDTDNAFKDVTQADEEHIILLINLIRLCPTREDAFKTLQAVQFFGDLAPSIQPILGQFMAEARSANDAVEKIPISAKRLSEVERRRLDLVQLANKNSKAFVDFSRSMTTGGRADPVLRTYVKYCTDRKYYKTLYEHEQQAPEDERLVIRVVRRQLDFDDRSQLLAALAKANKEYLRELESRLDWRRFEADELQRRQRAIEDGRRKSATRTCWADGPDGITTALCPN